MSAETERRFGGPRYGTGIVKGKKYTASPSKGDSVRSGGSSSGSSTTTTAPQEISEIEVSAGTQAPTKDISGNQRVGYATQVGLGGGTGLSYEVGEKIVSRSGRTISSSSVRYDAQGRPTGTRQKVTLPQEEPTQPSRVPVMLIPAETLVREAQLQPGTRMGRLAGASMTQVPFLKNVKTKAAESSAFSTFVSPSLTYAARGTPYENLPGQSAAELIPETGLGVGLMVSAPFILSGAAPIVRIGTGTAVGVAGGATAFDASQPLPKRVAGGFAGLLGFSGAAYEAYPYVRGTLSQFSPFNRPITTERVGTTSLERQLYPSGQARTIQQPDFKIRLVEPGRGFGIPMKQQQALIGQRVNLVTAQRGLDLSKPVPIGGQEGGYGMFFSPTPTGQPGALRVSRLGLTDLFKRPEAGYSMTLTRSEPQAIYIKDVPVTKTGLRPGSVRGVGYLSSELEVTKLPTGFTRGEVRPFGVSGEVLTGAKTGTAVISGQRVGLFSAKFSPVQDISKVSGTLIPGTRIVSQVPGLDVSSFSATPTYYVAPSGLTASALSGSLIPSVSTTTRTPSATAITSAISGSARRSVSSPTLFSSTSRTTTPFSPFRGSTSRGGSTPPSVPFIPSSPPSTPRRGGRPSRVLSGFSSPSYPVYRPKGGSGSSLFKAPKFKAKLFGGKNLFKFTSFKPRYTPSVKAQVFNIKGKKPKKQELITGLFTRPLLGGK